AHRCWQCEHRSAPAQRPHKGCYTLRRFPRHSVRQRLRSEPLACSDWLLPARVVLRSRSVRSLLTRAQHGYHVQVGLATISAPPPGGPDSLQTRLPSARSDATALPCARTKPLFFAQTCRDCTPKAYRNATTG